MLSTKRNGLRIESVNNEEYVVYLQFTEFVGTLSFCVDFINSYEEAIKENYIWTDGFCIPSIGYSDMEYVIDMEWFEDEGHYEPSISLRQKIKQTIWLADEKSKVEKWRITMDRYEQIMSNPRLTQQKPMTQDQLKAILKILAVYDTRVPSLHQLNVLTASEVIHQLTQAIKNGKLQKRNKIYRWVELHQIFVDKYPIAFEDIMTRNS